MAAGAARRLFNALRLLADLLAGRPPGLRLRLPAPALAAGAPAGRHRTGGARRHRAALLPAGCPQRRLRRAARVPGSERLMTIVLEVAAGYVLGRFAAHLLSIVGGILLKRALEKSPT